MSRARRLLVVAVAWSVPVGWVVVALTAGPSDGTTLSSSLLPPDRRGDTVTVAGTYGDTALRRGDEVLAVEGRSMDAWLGDEEMPTRSPGEVLRYEVRRPAPQLDRILEVDVTLTRYPFVAALRASPVVAASCLGLLVTGALVYWRRPGSLSARAFLLASALLPAVVTSVPWGTGVVDLCGGRGLWPQVGGEVLAATGLAALVVSTGGLAQPRVRWPLVVVGVAAPVLGYGVWLAAALAPSMAATGQAQVLATVVAPAVPAAVAAVLVVSWQAHRRAEDRIELLATRLVLLAVPAAFGGWLLVGAVPAWSTGEPLLPWGTTTLLATATALGATATAVAHYRLPEIEPRVRRGLVQGLVLGSVAAAFVALARALDVTADLSLGAMVVGGLLVLALLPVAVAAQRTLRRLVYGDRAFPRLVVSDLRRLDPQTDPEDVLREMLQLLARRLHLSYAGVEVHPTRTSGSLEASIGALSGTPVTVDLAVGGSRLGRLQVEVDAGHDPFGAGDRRLLEDVGTQVGALVQAVTANRELQRARQRLVAAREEERRRLRRDLHDGLGPSLASMAMRLEAVQDLIEEDPGRAAELVEQLADQVREEIGEVRRLVHGLRPPALDQLGLVTALGQRADQDCRTGGARVPWSVSAEGDLEPLPAAVELAAYRIVLEAVNNVQRHSGADRCEVRLVRDATQLQVTVRDTGRGVVGDGPVGVGLSSMRERAEELGGSFTVRVDEAGGTTVTAALPLGGKAAGDPGAGSAGAGKD